MCKEHRPLLLFLGKDITIYFLKHFMMNNLEILRANYWEHFKAAKDMALYLDISHPKRIRIEKELNEILIILNKN